MEKLQAAILQMLPWHNGRAGNARVQRGTDGGEAPMATAEASPEGLRGSGWEITASGWPGAAIP